MAFRGQVTDVPVVFILFVVAALGFWVSFSIIEALPSSGPLAAPQVQTSIGWLDSLQTLMDEVLVLTVFLMSVGVILLSFSYRQHPFSFVGGVFALFAVQFVFPPLANVLINGSQSPVLGAVANNFPLSIWLISNMPSVALVICAAVLWATYGKPANASVF